MSLPVLDLEPWCGENERARLRLALRLKEAASTSGFFYLAGHGVSAPLIQETRAAAKRFFSLPLEDRLRIHFEKARKQRGYIPLRAESSDPEGRGGDVKEALDFTFPIPPKGVSDAVAYRMYGPNLWPETLPGFRETVERYFDEMIRLGRVLFEVIATSLELPPGYFQDKTNGPIAQLRLLHYPPQPAEALELGIGAHCDYECFTILEQGDVGGLEIRDPEGRWVEVPPLAGAFVVNLGEMLQRWTNDAFKATPHRVHNRTGKERYTIPFFFGTNYNARIECLPTCCGPDRPARYQPILAGDYLARRLDEVYGSAPEKL